MLRPFLAAGILLGAGILVSAQTPASAQTPPPVPRPVIPASTHLPIPAHAPSLRFGVATHLRRLSVGWSPDLLPMIRALGVSSIRDEENWASVEKQKGVYQSSTILDEGFDRATALQLEPLMLLVYGNKLYGDGYDAPAMARYANWLIEHHKGSVKYLEIWNEPDNFGFRKFYGGAWNGRGKGDQDGAWIAKFAEFATIVGREIKKKHPEVKLVGYSSSPPSTYRLFQYPELWKNLDILAIHPYPFSVPPEITAYGGPKNREHDDLAVADDDKSLTSMLRHYREGLVKAGRPDMPIWITEIGYTTAQIPRKNLWLGFTENAQAIYNVRLGLISAGNGVDRTFFYDFYSDGKNPHELEQNYGLVRSDYSPKPAYFALQHLCTLLPGDSKSTAVGVGVNRLWPRTNPGISENETAANALLNTPQTYAFRRPDGTRVVFFWQPGRIFGDAQEELADLTLSLPAGEILEVGRVVSRQTLSPKITREGQLLKMAELPYGSDPVYVVVR